MNYIRVCILYRTQTLQPTPKRARDRPPLYNIEPPTLLSPPIYNINSTVGDYWRQQSEHWPLLYNIDPPNAVSPPLPNMDWADFGDDVEKVESPQSFYDIDPSTSVSPSLHSIDPSNVNDLPTDANEISKEVTWADIFEMINK